MSCLIFELFSKVSLIQTTFFWGLQKIFEGEMFIRTKPINLLQIIFCVMLNFQVIFKSFIDPDDIFPGIIGISAGSTTEAEHTCESVDYGGEVERRVWGQSANALLMARP